MRGCRIAVIIPVFQTGDRGSTPRTRTILMTKHLIIIPGIGDDHPVYHKGARVFRMFGFTPEVYVFGWNSGDPHSYESRITRLNNYLSKLDGEVYILGVSAGGSAAVNSFAAAGSNVRKVVTLCSPLAPFSSRVNSLLAVSIDRTEDAIRNLSVEQRQRILSLHAIFDPVVPTRLSKPIGVRARTLPSVLHPVTIFLGLTVFAGVSNYFFKQR